MLKKFCAILLLTCFTLSGEIFAQYAVFSNQSEVSSGDNIKWTSGNSSSDITLTDLGHIKLHPGSGSFNIL